MRRNLSLVFLAAFILTGCGKGPGDQARSLAGRSQADYQAAVNLYRRILALQPDDGALRFELGRLYFERGKFQQAIEELKLADIPGSIKLEGIAYYRLGNFTEALDLFSRDNIPDDESRYYHGLTCEKLNLFDKALEIYRRIKTGQFAKEAAVRIGLIEKVSVSNKIRQISPQTAEIIEKAPAAQNYPQAGAQILLCDEKIRILPDHRQVSTLHYVIRVLNDRGKSEFSETPIGYDSTYEKIELGFARTISADGEVVDVGTRHIRDVAKYLNFPLYSNARVFIISFPGVTEGACIEYQVNIYSNELIDKKHFSEVYPVQSGEPIITADFAIELPRDRRLYLKYLNEKYNSFGAELKPVVKETQDARVYSWHFDNIPQIIPETNMVPSTRINPTLYISTFNSWDEVYSWWWSLAKDKMAVDDALRAKVVELTKGLESEESRARAIYNFCARQIRYVAVEYGKAGYEPHRAADIFKNKYGDCKDQAILLAGMLRQAGIRAWPVLIGTKEYYDLNEDLPNMIFNHCIAAAEVNGKTIFFDTTAQVCSFGDIPLDDQARKVLLCTDEGYKILNTPLASAGENTVKQVVSIKVNADESIDAQKTVYTRGLYDQFQRYWLIYTLPELIRADIEKKIQGLSIGARLQDYEVRNLEDLDKTVELSYRFHGPEYFTCAGRLRIMPQLTDVDTWIVSGDKRSYPVDLEMLYIKGTKLNMSVPAGFVVKYMPQDINEESPWFKFSARYEYSGHEMNFSQDLEMKTNIISEEEYPAFKRSLETLSKKIKQRIILEKVK
jgi:transglutaminase-like putative cysteine protease